MSSDDELKKVLRSALEGKGLRARAIPASASGRSADFLIKDERDTYLVEVKSRAPVHGQGEVLVDASGRTNRSSGIIASAERQLAQARSHDFLRVMWVVTPPVDRELRYRQFESTAYGLRWAVCESRVLPCFYATHAAFHKFSASLDGIALGTFGALLLNDQSPRCARLKSSRLASIFLPQVRDPLELEAKGQAFIIRGAVDRQSKTAVLDYLGSHYASRVCDLTDLTRFAVDFP